MNSSFQTIGSLAIVRTTCHCGLKEWRSQPMQAKYAMGNVALAAALVFTGCSPMQTIRFLQHAGICCFCERTFHRLQARLLLPAINQVMRSRCSCSNFMSSYICNHSVCNLLQMCCFVNPGLARAAWGTSGGHEGVGNRGQAGRRQPGRFARTLRQIRHILAA